MKETREREGNDLKPTASNARLRAAQKQPYPLGKASASGQPRKQMPGKWGGGGGWEGIWRNNFSGCTAIRAGS